jgi:hypothetical protein
MNNRPEISTLWVFASESSPGKVYQTLQYTDNSTTCDCPAWTFKRKTTANGARTCKHVRFVDAGIADAHAISRKNYQEKKQTTPRPTGRKFDLTE